jgi:cytochrome c-type biogenesis protein CcmE
MKPRTRRLAWIAAGLGTLGLAAALVLSAFQSNLVFFFTPSQIAAKEAPQGRPFRVGGMVEAGSLAREPNSLTVRFRVTDTAQTIPVSYTGLLPDLFKEGKGVVAQGTLEADGIFHASEVLAKHDENYMPPQAKDAVDQARKGMTMKSLHQDAKADR